MLFRVIDLGEQPDYEPRILLSMRYGFLEVSAVPAEVDVRLIQ